MSPHPRLAVLALALAAAGCVVAEAPPPVPAAAPVAAGPAPECREYRQTITVGGQPREARGTSCRQPDGTWRIVRRAPGGGTVTPIAAAPAYPGAYLLVPIGPPGEPPTDRH